MVIWIEGRHLPQDQRFPTLQGKQLYTVQIHLKLRGCRGRNRMVDGFIITYAISVYHH
jgi:hypothetical protein